MSHAKTPFYLRFEMAVIGAIAGFCFWALQKLLPEILPNFRGVVFAFALAGGFFGSLLLLTGRLGMRVALRYSAVLGVVSAALLLWTSFRFASRSEFLDAGHPFLVFGLLLWLPLPFFLSAETHEKGWRDYEGLFDHAWSLFVRAFTAWAFTGVFWLVIFLSDQLLLLVGFEYIGDLIENLWFSMPLTGRGWRRPGIERPLGAFVALFVQLQAMQDGIATMTQGLALALIQIDGHIANLLETLGDGGVKIALLHPADIVIGLGRPGMFQGACFHATEATLPLTHRFVHCLLRPEEKV